MVEELQDGDGVAAQYLTAARQHERMGLMEYRNKRPVKSAKHTAAARALRRAAVAERENPPDSPRLLGSGE